MTRQTLALLLILGLSSIVVAQPPVPGPADADATAKVQSWYRRFLGRDADWVGRRAWSERLREGQDERDVLAEILGGGEYFWRSGSSHEGFVRHLWSDLTGQELDGPAFDDLVELTNREGRTRAARAMLDLATVDRPEHHDREWRQRILDEAERLSLSLERLAEDVVVELAGGRERAVYEQVEGFLRELDRFQRRVHANVDSRRLRDEFLDMDERLHRLTTNVRGVAGERPALLLRVTDVLRADRRMHAVVLSGAESEQDSQRVLIRQSMFLTDELSELRRTASYAIPERHQSAALLDHLEAAQRAAEHFSASLREDFDREHLRDDAAALSRSWAEVVDLMNQLPPRGAYHLRKAAQRADGAVDRIEAILNVDTDRARPYLP